MLRILTALRAEGDAPTLVVWQLSEDVHALAGVHGQIRNGTPIAAAVRNARVWGKRQTALEHAVNRVLPELVPMLLLALSRLDALAKGIGRGNVWDELTALALTLAGKSPRPLSL